MLDVLFFGMLLLGLALGAASASGAEIVTHGDLSAPFAFTQKPSSVKDQSAFRSAQGLLFLSSKFETDLEASLEMSYGRAKDPVTGRAALQVEKIYLSLPLDVENILVSVGQIGNQWVEMQEKEMPDWFYLGSLYQTPTLHWNELNRADNGILISTTGSDNFRASISVVNGEGAGMDEKGPRKEFQFHLQGMPFEALRAEKKLFLAMGVAEGAYEDVDSDLSQKERFLFFTKFDVEQKGGVSFEGFWSKDPVDKINKAVADEVDLTDLGGQVVKGFGAAMSLEAWLSEEIKTSFRYETFDPAQGVDARGLSSRMLGFHFFPRQMLQFSLAWLEVRYEKNHGVAARDSSELVFGARLRWP